jgi:hypothetical protein
MSGHLVPFALRTAFPFSLVGRYSHDYYETSVIYPARTGADDPAFVSVLRIERDLGAPFISLNSLTGNRPALRRVHHNAVNPVQEAAPVSDVGYRRMRHISSSGD